MRFITRLNHKLLFNIIFLLFLMIILCLRFTLLKPKSKYLGVETNIIGKVIEIKIFDEYTKLVIKGKEKLEVIYYDQVNYSLGDQVRIIGKLEKPEIVKVFNVFQYSNYLKSKKIYWKFKAEKIILLRKNNNLFYQVKENLIKYLDEFKSSSYLKAFIIGDNSEIDPLIKEKINTLGISHLFALSGMHVSLLSLIIFKVLKIFFSDKITTTIWVLLLISYLLLTNFSLSIVRAITCTIIIKIFKVKPIKVLSLLFLILLIVNPYYLYNLGFLFSFIISFFLILSKKNIEKKRSYFSKLFYTSYISFIASIPILAINFFEVNIFTPVINLVFIPFVTFILFPITLIAFIVPPLSLILDITIIVFESLISFFDILVLNINLPKLPLILYFSYFIILILILKDKKYNYLFIIFFIFHSFVYLNLLPSSVTMIDVNQGDSTLIRLANNKTNILIDTGGVIMSNNSFLAKNRIIPYIKSIGITKLDYLILTHGDFDHIGEAIYLVDNFKIDKVIFNCGEYNDLEKELIKVLNKKKVPYYSCIKELNIDNNKLYFLNNKDYGNENDNSSVIYTELNNHKFLFMGDVGVEVEKDILEKYYIKNIDFLKVGHHGSNTSSSEDFINSINPKYSLISVGKNNRYGHPKESVIDTLKNSKIYRTDIEGSIEIKLNKDGYKIKKCQP